MRLARRARLASDISPVPGLTLLLDIEPIPLQSSCRLRVKLNL
jgi:hypothetical protein